MRLKDKNAIIVGGTKGIGFACAEVFVREGASITIAGRNDNGEEIAAKLRGANRDVRFVKTDVTKKEDIKHLVENHARHFGGIDILFNNAAYPGRVQAIEDNDDDDMELVLATTLKSVYYAIKYAVPIMERSKRGGVIINTTAAGAREGAGPVGMMPYIGAKGGVIAVTRALAAELAPKGIRVNSLNPGIIETEMLRDVMIDRGAGARETFASRTLLRRVGEPREIADAALFLASNESSYVTGIDLLVDGGLVLG